MICLFNCFIHFTEKMPPRKRHPTSNLKKVPEKTPPSSTTNTSTNNDDSSLEPETAPPPNKRMTWAVSAPMPVAQQKQPEPVKKQPMNVIMQDFAATMENYKQFKKGMKQIQKHGPHNFVITNEFAEKMKEFSEKTNAMNALMPGGVHVQPIRKRIQLTLNNCQELFTQDDGFLVNSTSIELFGFKWYLQARMMEKGYLALLLHAKPPDGFKGNYRIEVDRRICISNALADKDLIKKYTGRIYTTNENNYTGWGYSDMAKFEDLLDPDKTFLTPEGDIEVWADFTIKSATLDHLI